MNRKARFVLSKRKLLEQYKTLEEFADVVSYSFKTNPIVGLQLEAHTKCLFTLHATEHLDFLKDKHRVILFGQGWDDGLLKRLVASGVRKFAIDNEPDLNTLLSFIEREQVKIDLFVRIKLKEHSIHTGKHFVYGLTVDKANALIPKLRENKNIGDLGIHFHRKTQNIGEWNLKQELEDSLSAETLRCISVLNIGGGLPVQYKNYPLENMPFILGKIKELRQWLSSHVIKLMIEPGRYLAGPCVQLEAQVINMYEDNVIINCSVYNAAMDTFVANTRLGIKGEKESGKSYTIKGCTPDSLDIFRYKVFLKEPKVGDILVFLNAGAYTYSTDFCNLDKVETFIIE